MDIWRERLPEFEGPALEAKYAIMNGRAFDPAERDAFAVDRADDGATYRSPNAC